VLASLTLPTTSDQAAIIALPDRHEPVVLRGLLGSGRTTALYRRYLALLEAGVPSEAILVWTTDKNDWLLRLEDDWQGPMGQHEIHTFRGWVQRQLFRWWPTLETGNHLPGRRSGRGQGKAHHTPTLLAVESAQAFLDRVTTDCRIQGACYEPWNLSKNQQIIQVLDALGRAVENRRELGSVETLLAKGYPGPAEDKRRFERVQCCFDTYRRAVYQHRIFDQAMQLDVFGRLLAVPAFLESLGRYRYALIDNVEESYPMQLAALQHVIGRIHSTVLAFDTNGGLREYLGSDFAGAQRFIETLTVHEFTESLVADPAVIDIAKRLSMVIVDPDTSLAIPPPDGVPIVLEKASALRADMIENVAAATMAALEAGVPCREIALIAPTLDPLLIWALRERFKTLGVSLFSHGGGSRLVDYRVVRCLLALLVMANPSWQRLPRRLDVIELLEMATIDNPMLAHAVYNDMEKFSTGTWPVDPERVPWAKRKWLQQAEIGYRRIWTWVQSWKARYSELPPDVFFHRAFGELLVPSRFAPLRPTDGGGDPGQRAELVEEIRQVRHLIDISKTLRQLDQALPLTEADAKQPVGLRILDTLQSGMVAERPFAPDRDDDAFLHLHTPQSYTQRGRDTRLQLWLDGSASGWYKSDVRPLVNPRVLSVNWNGDVYDAIADEHDQAIKLSRLALTMMLKLKRGGEIRLFSSQHDAEGRELFGDLPDRIESVLR
jgi:hypothetical protein